MEFCGSLRAESGATAQRGPAPRMAGVLPSSRIAVEATKHCKCMCFCAECVAPGGAVRARTRGSSVCYRFVIPYSVKTISSRFHGRQLRAWVQDPRWHQFISGRPLLRVVENKSFTTSISVVDFCGCVRVDKGEGDGLPRAAAVSGPCAASLLAVSLVM